MDFIQYLKKQRRHERKIWQSKNKKIKKIRGLKQKISSDDVEEELEELEEQELKERELVGSMIDKLSKLVDR